jgi:hypothetical protein
MTTVVEPEESEDFASWLGSPVVSVSLLRRHNQWYATADDFHVAGVGATEGEAYRDVAGLVDAYLHSCFAEGMTYSAACKARGTMPPPSDLFGLAEQLIRLATTYLLGRRRLLVVPSALHASRLP